jgi:formylglycine-generating enzyme required for sulfatase activity
MALACALLFVAHAGAAGSAKLETYTNSLGMEMVGIPAGRFQMGSEAGDLDERPVHTVTISRPFHMSATEVTNAQYEQFDPEHKNLRGKRGLSKGDDEAVVFVSWRDAARFCQWLSTKEGKPYRLPTEAEWEYACRADTTTAFHTGEELPPAYHRAQEFSWDPKPVDLTVGRTPPNPWGLHDMHGSVEEWCRDWYGPYAEAAQSDPVGYAQGLFKVTRGGSHNTRVRFLRSANRLGTLPEDKHWLIGFRVACGQAPTTEPLPAQPQHHWQRDVRQDKADWGTGPGEDEPFFAGPIPFVRPPGKGEREPFYRHNHQPSITWCDNGDLLAVWFSTRSERGREMTVLASRLRAGAERWDPASEFFKAPDRNMTGCSLFNDGAGTLYHFNGLAAADGWGNLALVLRTSTDNGATWSAPRLIQPEHQRRNQVIDGTVLTQDGILIQPCDAVWSGNGGTAIHVSRDGGKTWSDPGAGRPRGQFAAGQTGGTIAGIHAGVVELADGRWLAFGRGDEIAGRMCQSLSADQGRTWRYSASDFPPINGGQRLALLRLRDGPILFCSFTDTSGLRRHKDWPAVRGMVFRDSQGKERRGYGLFAAVSFDDGKTWPVRRLITPADGKVYRSLAEEFRATATQAEPRGYLAATQPPDGTIHLISSGLHYRFNLAWLTAQSPEGVR